MWHGIDRTWSKIFLDLPNSVGTWGHGFQRFCSNVFEEEGSNRDSGCRSKVRLRICKVRTKIANSGLNKISSNNSKRNINLNLLASFTKLKSKATARKRIAQCFFMRFKKARKMGGQHHKSIACFANFDSFQSCSSYRTQHQKTREQTRNDHKLHETMTSVQAVTRLRIRNILMD